MYKTPTINKKLFIFLFIKQTLYKFSLESNTITEWFNVYTTNLHILFQLKMFKRYKQY